MNVMIDHREPDAFQSLFCEEDQVSSGRLPCGDFLINDQWLFERKTIKDLCISLADGRLFKQALGLMQSDYHPVILLEGRAFDFKESGVSREAVQGALITLSIFLGLPVLRSLDTEESVRLMRYTVEQGIRFAEGGVPRAGYRPKGKKARQLFVLQGLPNIGKKRAENLLDHFGGIEAVISASEDDLAEVNGIGYPIAEKVRTLVQEAEIPYIIKNN